MTAQASRATVHDYRRKGGGMSYARADNDFYCEPPESVWALLDAEKFDGDAWDPACGRGNIPGVCEAAGISCVASDLVDRGYAPAFQLDFLNDPLVIEPIINNIICNPPYGQAEEFIRQALTIARRKVAMLLRLPFLESQRRAELFRSTPLSKVLIFPWRVSMPPGDLAIKATGGKIAYAWFIWERDFKGAPVIGWLEKPKAAA